MKRGAYRTISSMDQIVLLHPSPPSGFLLGHRHSSGDTDGCVSEGVVPRAINYQFMFIDLREPPPLPPMPPPPAVAAQPQFLRGTSLYSPAEDMGRPEDYRTLCELGRGSFAVVRKVVHCATGVEYAMKIMEKRKLTRGAGAGSRGREEQVACVLLASCADFAGVHRHALLLTSCSHPLLPPLSLPFALSWRR